MAKKMLIAEDSPQWQKFHASLLNTGNGTYTYEIAACARDALELVYEHKNDPYDLIFSDLQMETDFEPESAGEWFVKEVQKIPEYKKTKVVLVSAAYNIGFIAQRLGVDYLSKRILINYPEAYYSIIDKD